MELGKQFIRCAVRILISVMKSVPMVGAVVEVADSYVDEVKELEQEQQLHSLADRVRQLEEASSFSREQAKEIAIEVILSERQKGNNIGKEKEEAICDIISIMPLNVAQKTNVPLARARTMKAACHTVLPLDPKFSTQFERDSFYQSLIPCRRPKFNQGMKVPNKIGWEFEDFLGAGGFGEVWKIKHKLIGETQALKLCMEEKSKNFLLKEIQTIATLKKRLSKHENIVSILDANMEEEPYWISFEYVAGGTLENYIRAFGTTIPFKEALSLFKKICMGVAEAHKFDIVHRDLKPANILMTEADIPKISDFGLGKIMYEQIKKTSSKEISMTLRGYGTKGYMSVEQQEGEPAHPADDVYALGVIFYQMLLGNPAKDTRYFRRDLKKIETPQEIIDMIGECLEYPRNERPENAEKLLEKLDDVGKELGLVGEKKGGEGKKGEGKKVENGDEENYIDVFIFIIISILIFLIILANI